eukprot:1243909-Ditylum_brightwellii.AAC.1
MGASSSYTSKVYVTSMDLNVNPHPRKTLKQVQSWKESTKLLQTCQGHLTWITKNCVKLIHLENAYQVLLGPYGVLTTVHWKLCPDN